MSATRWRVGTKLGRTLYRDGQCVGMMDSAELAGEIITAMEALERIERTAGRWCVHCYRAEGDHTDNCPAGIATRARASHSTPHATPTDDNGPVVQASPETREMLAAMTARWPAPEPVKPPAACLCKDQKEAKCPCVVCGCALKNALRPSSPPSGHDDAGRTPTAGTAQFSRLTGIVAAESDVDK